MLNSYTFWTYITATWVAQKKKFHTGFWPLKNLPLELFTVYTAAQLLKSSNRDDNWSSTAFICGKSLKYIKILKTIPKYLNKNYILYIIWILNQNYVVIVFETILVLSPCAGVMNISAWDFRCCEFSLSAGLHCRGIESAAGARARGGDKTKRAVGQKPTKKSTFAPVSVIS